MARNLKSRLRKQHPVASKETLAAFILYLEALETLYGKSDTLPESTKHSVTLILEELDYLLWLYGKDTETGSL